MQLFLHRSKQEDANYFRHQLKVVNNSEREMCFFQMVIYQPPSVGEPKTVNTFSVCVIINLENKSTCNFPSQKKSFNSFFESQIKSTKLLQNDSNRMISALQLRNVKCLAMNVESSFLFCLFFFCGQKAFVVNANCHNRL